ncbi:MAG: dynamin family protein, partial [Synergistaceae bacterium]|nr:dynamin family protein [Synergistaceae bacterium]
MLCNKLQTISITLKNPGGLFIKHAEKINELAGQLEEEKLNLAVLGQFKRGKSTLINALLKAAFLPAAVLPLTAVPTKVSYGKRRSVQITFETADSETKKFDDDESMLLYLNSFVTEEGNPCNIKNVKDVETEYPSEFLSKGIVLIDTPGTGSTYRHNTETTMEFIDSCDAALFVLSVDPPITENELNLIRFIRERISKIFIILNKTDYCSEHELSKISDFLIRTLENSGCFKITPFIYKISALNALQAKEGKEPYAYEKSGIPMLEADLISFFKTGKKEVLKNAVKRKSIMILREVILQAELNIKALEMPLDELRQKREDFEMKLVCLKNDRESFFDLVSIDKKNTVSFCKGQMAALKINATEHFDRVLKSAAGTNQDFSDTEKIIAEDIVNFFSKEFEREAKVINERTEEVFRKYTGQLNSHVDNIRFMAASIFNIECSHIDTNIAIRKKRLPYWTGQVSEKSLISSGNTFFDFLLPVKIKREKEITRINENTATLIINNVENMRWSLIQNIESLFREFVSDISRKLNETIDDVVRIV